MQSFFISSTDIVFPSFASSLHFILSTILKISVKFISQNGKYTVLHKVYPQW